MKHETQSVPGDGAPVDSGQPKCRAPEWCGTDCLGSKGPGFVAKRAVDYVVGMHTELFCSVACRDARWPELAYLPPDFGSDTFDRQQDGRWVRRTENGSGPRR